MWRNKEMKDTRIKCTHSLPRHGLHLFAFNGIDYKAIATFVHISMFQVGVLCEQCAFNTKTLHLNPIYIYSSNLMWMKTSESHRILHQPYLYIGRNSSDCQSMHLFGLSAWCRWRQQHTGKEILTNRHALIVANKIPSALLICSSAFWPLLFIVASCIGSCNRN